MRLFAICFMSLALVSCKGPQQGGDAATLVKGSGNGQPYGGQISLSGIYYNSDFNYTACPPYRLRVDFDSPRPSGDALLDGDACGNGAVGPLAFSDLEIALYNLDVMGYGAHVVERRASPPPADLDWAVEILCRLSDEKIIETGADVIIRKRKGSRLFAQVVTGERIGGLSLPTKKVYPEVEVQANPLPHLRRFEAGSFSLTIDTSTSLDSKFSGQLEAVLNDGKVLSTDMSCRIQ
jgi:hypothetical protein